MNGIKSRTERTKKTISELEQRTTEIIQSEQNGNRLRKNEKRKQNKTKTSGTSGTITKQLKFPIIWILTKRRERRWA